MKTKRQSKILRVKNPLKPSHGALRLFLPWAKISPKLALGGGNPSPKKSKEARVVILPHKIKGK